jgi:hypothetical protein
MRNARVVLLNEKMVRLSTGAAWALTHCVLSTASLADGIAQAARHHLD